MMRWAENLSIQLPVYVTRESADGTTGSYSMSLWMSLLALLLIWLNVVVWSVIGIVKAIEVIT